MGFSQSGDQLGVQIRFSFGRPLGGEEVTLVGSGVEIEGEVVINGFERNCNVLGNGNGDESVLPASHVLNALRHHQRLILPGQHVAHDLGARPADKSL